MGSYKIRRLQLPKGVIEILENQNLNSCKDVLCLTKVELQTLLGLNQNKIESILSSISKKCVSKPQTAYDMYVNQHSSLLPTFLPLTLHSMDLLLQGGLPLGSLTEIAGPPGVGKTQFCFMLSVLATLPLPFGCLDGHVIYIDTESAFCAERLKTIAVNRFPQFFKDESDIAQVLQKVFVYKVNSINTLKEIGLQLDKEIIRNKVKLIILDSIASLMRKEFGTDARESLLERNKILLEQAALLKDLAQTYNIVVLLTNQITSHHVESDPLLPEDTYFDEASEATKQVVESTGSSGVSPPATVGKKIGADADHVIPALGNTWSHCVNTRLIAQFLDPSVRQLTIAKSPIAPNASVRYLLDETGIVLVDDHIEFVTMPDGKHTSIQTKYNFLTPSETGTGVVFSTGAGTSH